MSNTKDTHVQVKPEERVEHVGILRRLRLSLISWLPDQKQSTQEDAKEKVKRADKRNLLSSFFITLLIGLAYQEMIAPVRVSLRASGLTYGTVVLVIVFFLTSIRFFVGNQLHLLSEELAKISGFIWLYDLMMIIIQSMILVILGGISSIEESRVAFLSFHKLLIFLYAVDVVWIASQRILGWCRNTWCRTIIPTAWAYLNTSLIIGILLIAYCVGDMHSTHGLTGLLILSVIGFIIDIALLDIYDAI